MACYLTNTVYDCDAKTIFQASVHILRQDTQAARDVFSGKLQDFSSISELLGPTNHDLNQTVLGWFEGNNDFVPENPDHFFDRVFLQLNFTDPEIMSTCGFLEQAGIKCHNGFLSDYPSDIYENRLKRFNDYTMKVLNENTSNIWPDITPCQRTSCKVLLWTVKHSNRSFRSHIFPIDQFYGYHSRYMFLMTDLAVVEDNADIQRYISRVIGGGHKFNRVVADMKRKEAVGAVAPRCCLEKVASTIKQTLFDLHSEDNKLVRTATEKYKAASGDILPDNYIKAIRHAIELYLIPGLTNCLSAVRRYIQISSDEVGVCKMQDGEDYYDHCLRWETTTTFTPEQIFNLGKNATENTLDKVVQVVKMMNENGDMTLNSSDPPTVILRDMFENKKFRFQNGPEGKKDIIKYCQNLLKEISTKVDHLFREKPLAACEVSELPEAMSLGGAAAFYQESTLDLTRPGIFYINTGNMATHLKPQMKSLTAHESVPGHHFQISRMMENRKLPAFRRRYSSRYAGFVEGWGLYCEYLANEIGFYKDKSGSDSYDTLGYYTFELLRSTRLVADTGIHRFKWSREKAIQYMIENTGMDRERIESEIDRYCVLPGQACSYKIGQMKILEIRAKLEKQEGFDLAKFHDKLLGLGSVPLEILEEEMLSEEKV